MKRLPLRIRLGVWSALILALPSIVFGCVVAVHLYHEQIEEMEDELHVEAGSILAKVMQNPAMTGELDGIRTLIEPFHQYLEILDLAGHPIHRSPLLAGVPTVTDPQAAGTARTLTINGVAVRQFTAAADGYTVSLGGSMTGARQNLRVLLRGYALAAPLLLAMFALGATWIAKYALQPIEEITARAESISAGSLDTRLPLPPANDELRRLTEVLNSMMARLDRSFQQVTRFTSNASHELRTPLAVLRAELETALRPSAPAEGRAARIHSMLEEVQRLSTLVDSLLLLSQSDAGKLSLELLPTDLSRMTEAATEDARVLGEDRQLHIECEIPPGITVLADASRLRQVLLNLVDNAGKFNRPGGRVRIVLGVGQKDITLRIGNTGPGLTPEHRARLFERFFRGDTARSRTVAGFGLGLSLSREIMLAHGGRLELTRSEADWTEFSAVLPAASASAKEPRDEEGDTGRQSADEHRLHGAAPRA